MLLKWRINEVLLLQCSRQHRTEYRKQVVRSNFGLRHKYIFLTQRRQAAWGSSGKKSGEESEDYTEYGIYFVVVVVVVDYSVHVYYQNEAIAIVLHTSPLFLG